MVEKQEKIRGHVLAVGLNCGGMHGFENSDDATMEELTELVRTAGGEVICTAVQNRHSPDPKTFIGEGKAQELKQTIGDMEIDLVVFDNDISPSQTKALEQALDCRVIDRSALILDIFADRAKTAEGKLQVELAQYQYMLPRLTRMWQHLVRQTASGGPSPIGTRGPGETQLETDRRHIRQKIQRLERQLKEVHKVRSVQRASRERSNIPQVCLVGYTNAGKSTLLNSLTGAGVHAENRLFDTLDPTTKIMHSNDMGDILISDTVGFIRKLPHHLINAFKATLEEITFADVILHVVDVSSENWQEQAEVTEQLIEELYAGQTPRITVFNKVDKLPSAERPIDKDAMYCSALKGIGLEKLVGRIADILQENLHRIRFLLPYSNAGILDALYRDANVKKADYVEEGIDVDLVCDGRIYGRIKQFVRAEEA